MEEKHGVSADTINGINHGIEPMSSYRKDTEEKKVILGELVYKYINGKITYDAFEKEVIELCDNKGESKPALNDFDIESAKAGKPVCTRDGRKARIVCFDKEKDIYPIIALVEDKDGYETICQYTEKGMASTLKEQTAYDLMMLPEKKEGWIVIHKEAIYDKETAEKIARETTSNVIKIQKIEWEE